MTHVVANLVKQSSTSAGLTTIELTGAAVAPFRNFSDVMADGDTADVTVVRRGSTQWQTARYVYAGPAPGTLTFQRFIDSPTGVQINFGAGPKDVYIGPGATRGVFVEVETTSAYQAGSWEKVAADTRGGPFTVTLDADAVEDDRVKIWDLYRAWGTNQLTIKAPAGISIDDFTEYDCKQPAALQFAFIGGKWRLVSCEALGTIPAGLDIERKVAPVPDPGEGVSDNEFNGPFIDWLDAVANFSADNTGAANTSAAIQNMVNAIADTASDPSPAAIGNPSTDPHYQCYTSQVGFLPPGHYLIDQTILLVDSSRNIDGGSGKSTDSFEGKSLRAKPGTVTLEWVGAAGGDILYMNGCNGSTVQGFKFILNNARSGIRFERDTALALTSQTGNQIVDCEFQGDYAQAPVGGQYGVFNTQGTGPDANQGTDSEMSITRCRFYSLNNRGICVTGIQSYNFWIRQCWFESCSVPISNGDSGTADTYPFDVSNLLINSSGAFHVFDCTFNGSTFCDIQDWGKSPVYLGRNVSLNANRFLMARGDYIALVDNRIVDPIQTDCLQFFTAQRGNTNPALDHAPIGRARVILLDNKIKSRPDASGPVIREVYDPAVDADELANDESFRNYYVATKPIWFARGNRFSVSYSGVIVTDPNLDNTTILDTLTGQTIDTTVPLKVPYAQVVARQVFVLGQASGESPQTTVNAAVTYEAAHPGSCPVVYHPSFTVGGAWNQLSVPLEFPANVKMSYQGCGVGAVFGWTGDSGATDTPILLLRGPSRIILRDIKIGRHSGSGGKAGRQILIDNCDQAGSRLISEKGSAVAFRFVELQNLKAFFLDFNLDGDGTLPAEVIGHSSATSPAALVLLEGTTLNNNDTADPIISLQGSGKLLVRGFWFESSQYPQTNYALSGSGPAPGWFSFEGGRSFNGAPDFGITDVDNSDPAKTLTISQIGSNGYGPGTTVHVAVSDGSIGSWVGKVVDGASGGNTAQVRITSVIDGSNALGITLDQGWASALQNTPLTNWTLRTFDTNWRYVQMTAAGFKGQIALVGSNVLGELQLSGDCSATDYFNLGGSQVVEAGDPSPRTLYRNHGPLGGQESIQYGDYTPVGITGTLPSGYATLLQMLADTKPDVFLAELASGVTDVRLYRVLDDVECIAGTYS